MYRGVGVKDTWWAEGIFGNKKEKRRNKLRGGNGKRIAETKKRKNSEGFREAERKQRDRKKRKNLSGKGEKKDAALESIRGKCGNCEKEKTRELEWAAERKKG